MDRVLYIRTDPQLLGALDRVTKRDTAKGSAQSRSATARILLWEAIEARKGKG